MLLINCEINLSLTWFTNYFIVDAPDDNEELFASVVTLSNMIMQNYYDNWNQVLKEKIKK